MRWESQFEKPECKRNTRFWCWVFSALDSFTSLASPFLSTTFSQPFYGDFSISSKRNLSSFSCKTRIISFLFSIVYKGPITKTPKRKFANLAVSFLYSLSNNFLELVFLGFGDFGPCWLLLKKQKTPKNKILINAVLFSVSVDRIPILLIWVSLSPRPLLCFKDFCSPKLQPDWRRMAVWWDMW